MTSQLSPPASPRLRPWLAVIMVCACGPQLAIAQTCPGISEDTARRVFERLKSFDAGTGYRFEGLRTIASEMSVVWSRDGQECPTIAIHVDHCDSPLGLAEFRVDVPSDLRARCPALEPIAQQLSAVLAGEHPVNQHLALPGSARRPFIAIIVTLLIAGLVIRQVLSPPDRRGVSWRDGMWIGLMLGLAALIEHNVLLAATVGFGGGWLLLGGLLCDPRLLSLDDRLTTLAASVLFGFGLLLHWSLSSGGPGDLHLNLAAVWTNEVDLRWGPAPIAGFRLLRLLMGDVDDTAIIWCNLVLSALIPVLVYAIIARLKIDRAAAFAAALLVACHPVLIAFSGVLGREPTYLFAASASLLGLVAFLERGTARYLTLFVLGAVLATTTRPEGAQVLIVSLAVLLLVPSSRRIRISAALAAAVVGTGAYLYVTYALFPKPLTGKHFAGDWPFLWTILLNRDDTPSAWIAVWLIGLIVAFRRRAAWLVVLALAGLDLAWRWSDLYRMFVGLERHVAAVRYQTILLVPFAIATALLVQAVRASNPRTQSLLAVVFVAGTALTFQRPYDVLLRSFTADYEYRFLRRHAATLPAEARVYVLDAPFDDMGFIDAQLTGEFVRSAGRFGYWSERRCDQLIDLTRPTYLYIGSTCAELIDAPGHPLIRPAYGEWLAECSLLRARASANVVEEIDVPARKMSWHDFKDETTRLGLYRLVDPSICELGWRSSFHARDGS